MKRYQKVLFPAVIALQLAVLGVMIAGQEVILAKGTKVMLKCVPVDPRSLFSGDYVILNYEISELSNDKFPELAKQRDLFKANETVYVGLVSDGKFYTVKEVSRSEKYIRGRYPVFLKGKVREDFGDALRIRYGLESYFVPQNEGKIIEQDLDKVSVEVSVDRSGHSAIARLFIAGKEVRFY